MKDLTPCVLSEEQLVLAQAFRWREPQHRVRIPSLLLPEGALLHVDANHENATQILDVNRSFFNNRFVFVVFSSYFKWSVFRNNACCTNRNWDRFDELDM